MLEQEMLYKKKPLEELQVKWWKKQLAGRG